MSYPARRTDQLVHPTPGQILRQEFMEPEEISSNQLARSIGVELTRVSQILAGKRAINADTALRLGRFFGNRPESWLSLQACYDLWKAERELAAELEQIEPHRWREETRASDQPDLAATAG